MKKYENGLFSDDLMKEIRSRFHCVDYDPHTGEKRIFFENAGGSYRLKAALEAGAAVDLLPDCPDRGHRAAGYLNDVLEKGIGDARTIFNAKDGVIALELTATQMMFTMVETIVANVAGGNAVTTALEHPSAFDAVDYCCRKYGKELRVATVSKDSGGVEAGEIAALIDENTVLLSVMYASNFSGAVMDLEKIVTEARKKKPDLYIVVDAVQHAAHGIIDMEKTPVDGMNFGPYKFFGCRGIGIGYLSQRLARLPHAKVIRKPEDEWRLGSPVPLQMASLSAVVDYVTWIGAQFTKESGRRELYEEGIKRIKNHETALLERMLEGTEGVKGLRCIEGVKVCPDCWDLSKRDLIVPVIFPEKDHAEVVNQYEEKGIIVRETPAQSMFFDRILDAFDLPGALRISPLHCNTVSEVDQFLKITEEIAAGQE